MYVCLCRGLTESDVRTTVEAGHRTARDLIATLGLRGPKCCGRCAREVGLLLAQGQRDATSTTLSDTVESGP